MSEDSPAQQRLKSHNPFVVRLFDREGIRRENFQFFDGGSKLVTLPMTQFDGYPLKNEYRFFISASILVVIGILLPVLPVSIHGLGSAIAWVVVAYLAAVAFLGIWVVFHLVSIRTTYIAANGNIHATDLASKADAVRQLIHTFKSIVRWRRFMRYSMNLGLILLVVVAAVEMFFLRLSGADSYSTALSGGLFLMSAAVFCLFELGRKKLTEGMDPTLALVHMVEEMGNQLIARGQFIVKDNGAS